MIVLSDEFFVFFFKQKTPNEMRISDCSSAVCSSDLLHALHRAGLKAGVAVNVSALLPADPMFAKHVKTLLTHYAVAPHTLTLEVTESIAMSNQDAAIPAPEGLAELGIDLSIDDYGTGQSTLSYLKQDRKSVVSGRGVS